MSTVKKFAVDAALVHKLIVQQFPRWQHLPIRSVQNPGWDHFTFHLGDDKLIRLPSANCYVEQVQKEYEWLPRLAAGGLPVTIPAPLGLGAPSKIFPYHFLVTHWIPGHTGGSREASLDLKAFAGQLADFMKALHQMPTIGGPQPGPANFYRGGDLRIYNEETLRLLHNQPLSFALKEGLKIWEAALSSQWAKASVWVHGDISMGNLLFTEKRLTAVIDWGLCCVGDPACDLMLACAFLKAKAAKFSKNGWS